MSLAAATRFGSYDVLSAIGAGAWVRSIARHVPPLNRDVAIKVCRIRSRTTRRCLARFPHDAQRLAPLNHPNIARIHGFEDSAGLPALIMEPVRGELVLGVSADTPRRDLRLAKAWFTRQMNGRRDR
jgi:hypothetical protein